MQTCAFFFPGAHSIAQSCLTLCNPMDCSPAGSSVHVIFQAKILEWVAISSSRGSSRPQGLNPHLRGFLHWQVDSLPLSQWEYRKQSQITKRDGKNLVMPASERRAFTFYLSGWPFLLWVRQGYIWNVQGDLWNFQFLSLKDGGPHLCDILHNY